MHRFIAASVTAVLIFGLATVSSADAKVQTKKGKTVKEKAAAKHVVLAPPILRVTVPQPDVVQQAIDEEIIRNDIATPVTLPTGEVLDVTGLVVPIRFPDGHAATISTVPGHIWTNELGNSDSMIRMETARTLLTDRETLPATTYRRFMDDTASGTIAGQFFMRSNRRTRPVYSRVYLDTGAPVDMASGRMYMLTSGSFNHAPGRINVGTEQRMTTPYDRDFLSPAGRKRLPNFITDRPGRFIQNF
jgi:hypothetical protein